jgi:hypothetical protein
MISAGSFLGRRKEMKKLHDLDDHFETKLLNLDRRIHYAAAIAAARNCVES